MAQIITVLSATISEFDWANFDSLHFLAIVAPLTFAIVFYFCGFITRTSLLTKGNSIVTTGKLVVFEQLGAGSSPLLYADNKPGRVPIFNFELDGEEVSIGAAYYDRSLTKDDRGKQFRVRYRRVIWVSLCVDDEMALRHHNLLVNRGFWITMGFASISLLLEILTWIYGAGVVWYTIFKPLFPLIMGK